MIHITLPDGSQREFPGPVTVAEVAASIGAGLAKAALAGKIDGKVVDTSYQITQDSPLSIITAKDADGLDVIRRLVPAAAAAGARLLAVELGEGQAPAVMALMSEAGFRGVEARRDLAGIERVVVGVRRA
jgi:threonyl-tRNA synthetase